MARVEIDIEEAERFARTLEKERDEIETRARRIRSKLDSLGSHWRDAQFNKFKSSLESTLAELEDFKSAAEEELQHLRRKIREAREFAED